jgi:hypothetical protein
MFDTNHRTMWNPFWLRRAWLGAYAALFCVMALMTLALYIISVRKNGFEVSNTSTGSVYFWKYLPTASKYGATVYYLIAPAHV